MSDDTIRWPKHLKISKEDFQPYVEVSDVIKSEEFQKMIKSSDDERESTTNETASETGDKFTGAYLRNTKRMATLNDKVAVIDIFTMRVTTRVAETSYGDLSSMA